MAWMTKSTKNKPIEVLAPLTGKTLPLEQVPDPAFSQKFMGDGVAIEPSDGLLVSPFEGTVAHLIDTHHAVILEHESGVQILLHIGINTVELKGQGFKALVATGDAVKAGQTLIEFDLEAVKSAGYPVITPVVFANQEIVESFELAENELNRGQSILMKFKAKS